MKSSTERYHTLDGMRGASALLVAEYHFAQSGPASVFPGYLAVDLFFVLSGFVIALTYTDRLNAGLTASRFTQLRLVRLFPLYFIGLLLGVGRQVLSFLVNDPRAMSLGVLACNFVIGALMLPSGLTRELYPLNGPAWSLFFELVINVAFAAYLWRWKTGPLLALMAVAAAYLCFAIGSPYHFNVGWGWDTALQGAARTAFSFPAGMLLFRCFRGRPRQASWWALAPLLAMTAIILTDVPESIRPVTQLSIVFFILPMLVMTGICIETPRRLTPFFGFLGDLSYPIYAIHWPLIYAAQPVLAKLNVPAAAAGAVFVLLLIPAGAIAAALDTRVRARLGDWLGLRKTAPAHKPLAV